MRPRGCSRGEEAGRGGGAFTGAELAGGVLTEVFAFGAEFEFDVAEFELTALLARFEFLLSL